MTAYLAELKTMIRSLHKAAILTIVVASLLPLTGAQAQWYGSVSRSSPPLYPYAVPRDQPYAVEVAPNTYFIRRPSAARTNSYVRGRHANNPVRVQSAPARDRRHGKARRALIEEMQHRSRIKRTAVNATMIVRDPPVVIETRRGVENPPRVIQRQHGTKDKLIRSRDKRMAVAKQDSAKHKFRAGDKNRVVRADAEVTILGPDRMIIKLFRIGGYKAKVRAD
jgi:hypothetical protein